MRIAPLDTPFALALHNLSSHPIVQLSTCSKLAIIGNALFGTEIILSKTHCYRDSYRALTPSVLWMMSKHSIGALIEAYPDMKKAIRAAAIRLAFALHVCEVLEEMSTKQNNPKP